MTTRRDFLKITALGSIAGSLLTSCGSISRSKKKLTILHTNDVHSHIEPFPANHKDFPNIGGYARRSALIKQIRKQEENVVLLDCGDIFQGTPYFNFYKGSLDISLMGKMKYDAATLGNHEFDNGIDELSNQISKADFSFINSNYTLKNTPLENLISPYKIITKGSVKIGIIGAGIQLEGLVNKQMYGNIIYNDPTEICSQIATKLKTEEQCDIVICLSHLGYEYESDKISDIVLAKKSENIDIILGGHTHTFMDKPTLIKNKNNKTVVVNQAGWGGVKLGRIDITLNEDGLNLNSHSSTL